jgi:hypothetical protein
MDAQLWLHRSSGGQLGTYDSDRGFCSLIDGTGTTKLHASAGKLAADTYAIRVARRAASETTASGKPSSIEHAGCDVAEKGRSRT